MTTTKTTQSATAPTLNIDGFRFEELRIAPLDRADAPQDGGSPVLINYDHYFQPGDLHRFAVALKIVAWVDAPESSDAAAARFEVRVSALGFFTSTEQLPAETLPFSMAVNGCALLYGIIRGVVRTAGSWFESPALLPTVNFSRMIKERSQRVDAPPPKAPRALAPKRQRKLRGEVSSK